MDDVLAPSPDLAVTPPAPRDRPSMGPDGKPLDPGIEGVEVVRPVRHVDSRGSLIELINIDHPFWREPVVHCEYVTARPGQIKGWGMHKESHDRYFVDSRTRLVLCDGRVESPTHEKVQQIWFSEESPGLVRIPAGVWHATQNWGDTDAAYLVFPTRPHQHHDPDKYRLDPLNGPIGFDWTLPAG
jgi:dTDP-4-dehydrorhamnose 3,5-epimerase